MVYELTEVYGCCFLVATVEGWSLRCTCSWRLAVGAAGVKCSGSQFKVGRQLRCLCSGVVEYIFLFISISNLAI